LEYERIDVDDEKLEFENEFFMKDWKMRTGTKGRE